MRCSVESLKTQGGLEELRNFIAAGSELHEEEEEVMVATEEGTDAIPPELGVRPPHASDASVPPPPPPAAVAPPPPPQVAAASPNDLLLALHSHAVSLNLSEEPPGSMRYHLGAAGALRFVGHLRTIRGSWKATCRSGHGSSCSFFLTPKAGNEEDILGDLLAWLAAGPSSTAEAHDQVSYELKVNKYKMRVRKRG